MYDTYRELAEQTLYTISTTDPTEEQAAISKGQAWATLTLAAAIHELAQAQDRP